MAKFEITYYKKAEKDLDSIKTEEALTIMDNIERFLSVNPFPERKRKKRIHGVMYPLYRLRVDTPTDSYRIFYLIERNEIVVLRIVKKRDMEKAIRALKKRI